MPYFKTSQEWVEQSALLLEAHPATTRITTRYSLRPARKRRGDGDGDSDRNGAGTAAATSPRGNLVFKTFDPVSGVTLKYRTTKAAEVSRLIYSALGRLGRSMAAVPAEALDEPMLDAPAGSDAAAKDKPDAVSRAQPSQPPPQQGGTSKRKKKGRK